MIIRSLREELDVAKSQLNDTRYDLKEAKFELAQLQTKCDKLNEERKLMDSVHRTQQLELQLKMESSLKRNEEKSHLFSIETEKLAKVAEKLVRDVSSDVGRHQALRTHLHLLEKLAVGLNKMKDINSGASSVSSIAELKASISLREVSDMQIHDVPHLLWRLTTQLLLFAAEGACLCGFDRRYVLAGYVPQFGRRKYRTDRNNCRFEESAH